jgi:protoporphyrinogen oxidase
VTTAILGGGLSGLTLARLLHERGDDVVVLEAEKDYGGLCRSYIENGFTFDIGGSHIIFSRDTEVLSFMRSMIEGNEKRDTRNTKIFYKSNYVKYPFENGISDLPFKDRFFCFNEFLKTLISIKIGKQSVPKNFKEWIYYTFGKGIAECYMIPYNEKIWKYPTNRMSMHWVEGRIPRPPVKDVIKAAIGIPTEGYTHQAVFSYPLIGGIKSLIHAISSPIKDRIKTGFRIQSIKKKSNCWQISDGVNTIEFDRCINTIPLQHLLPCLENVPSDVISACNALVYNSLVCVTIGIQGSVPPFSWLYIPSPSLGKTNRISFPSNYSPEVTPHGYGSILAEITHHPYDEVARMTDEELTNEVIATLNAMKIGIKDRIVYTRVWRQPFAYVVYDLEYQKNIKVIRDYCTHIKIPLVGRFAQFEYLNMDGCIRSVMDFVRTYPPEPHAF